MAIGKGLKIGIVLIAIVGVIVPITAVTLINIENERVAAWNRLLDSDDRIINFTVNGVVVGNISYNRIVLGISGKQEDANFTELTTYPEFSSELYTGVPLSNVIDYSGVDYGSCNGVQFVGTDNYDGPFVLLSEIYKHPTQYLVCWELDGVNTTELEDPEDPGELLKGALFIQTNYTVTEPKPNSYVNAKWLGTVRFVQAYDYDLTIFGEGILEKNATIPFGLTNMSRNNVMQKTARTFNYTSATESWTASYFGSTLGGYLFSRTSGLAYQDSWSVWDRFRYVGQDGTTSPWMSKADAITNPNCYMVAWQKNSVDIGWEDGLLMGICNYSVYQGSAYSNEFFINNLVGIELGITP